MLTTMSYRPGSARTASSHRSDPGGGRRQAAGVGVSWMPLPGLGRWWQGGGRPRLRPRRSSAEVSPFSSPSCGPRCSTLAAVSPHRWGSLGGSSPPWRPRRGRPRQCARRRWQSPPGPASSPCRPGGGRACGRDAGRGIGKGGGLPTGERSSAGRPWPHLRHHARPTCS